MTQSTTADWNETRRSHGDAARDEATVRKDFWRKLQRLASQLPFAEDLLTAYYCAFDRKTPTHVRAMLLGALAYFVMPIDIEPDFLPLIGFTDDAAILAATIKMIWSHIQPSHREAAREALTRLGGKS